MSRLFAFPAGRRAKWVVFFAWILALALMLGTNLPGKYSDAEQNESTSFLPEEAESTKALAITEALQNGERAPTIIVYKRRGGLTPADEQRITGDIQKLDAVNRSERLRTRRTSATPPARRAAVSRSSSPRTARPR